MREWTDRGIREKMEVIMGRLKETRVVVGDGVYVGYVAWAGEKRRDWENTGSSERVDGLNKEENDDEVDERVIVESDQQCRG